MSAYESPQRKCTVEIKLHIHRWQKESDLEPQEIVDAINDAVEEYFELEKEEEEIEFDPDIDLGTDEE
jgi:hypothetical protein